MKPPRPVRGLLMAVLLLLWTLTLTVVPAVTQATDRAIVASRPPLRPQATSMTICKNQSIPAGYVIVGQGTSTLCPGNFPNTWTISTPSSGLMICKVSPVPSGYVIVGQGTNTLCPGSGSNAWIIRKS